MRVGAWIRHTEEHAYGVRRLQRRFILLGMAVLVVALGVMGLRLGRPTPTEAAAERVAAKDLTAYTLPAGKLEKAIVLERTRIRLTVVGTVWSLAELVLILWAGAVARLRDFAVSVAKNRWAQGSVFVLGFLLLIALLNLPLGIYGHTVALRYGLSVQGWASWLGDKAKLIGLEWLVGTLLVMLMFWIIR